MAYTVQFQTEPAYKNMPYGRGTIYSSACGPASLCNALHVLGVADISLPAMCALAVRAGARVEGGTWMPKLLEAAAPRYGFTYTETSQNLRLLRHLQQGGTAVLHAGPAHPLFSSGGHFVAAAQARGNTITVLDSYWYSGKYTSTALRRNYTRVIQKGVIETSLQQCGRATQDRSPSYYLLSKKILTETDDWEDTMQYYEKTEDMSVYYRKAVQKLMDCGAIAGTGTGLHLSEDLCRAFAILDQAGVLPEK